MCVARARGSAVSVLGNEELRNVKLPSLTTIGEYLDIKGCYYSQPCSFTYPVFTSSGGSSYSYTNNWYDSSNYQPGLEWISMPSLLTIGTHMAVSYNQGLEWVSMPALTTISDYLYIYDNDVMVSLVANNLRTIGNYLQVSDHTNLANVTFTALQNVTSYVNMYNNQNLQYVRARAFSV